MRATAYNKEISERQKLAARIVQSAEKYTEDIKNAAKYAIMPPYAQYETAINVLSQIKPAPLGKTVADCAKSYASVVELSSAMEKVMEFINNYDIFAGLSRNISQTKLATINLYRVDIQAHWNRYSLTAANNLHALLLAAVSHVVDGGKLSLAVSYVTTAEPDDFTTALTSKLLAEKLKPADQRLLQNWLEKRLDKMFSMDGQSSPGYLSRHNFVPSACDTLDNILSKHKPDTTHNHISSGKVPGETLVLIEYSTKNAIEFTVDRLISRKIIEDESLEVQGGSGLTKKVLKRYTTTTAHPGEEKEWSVRVLPGDKPQMTILESISPGLWRFMTSGYTGKLDASNRPQVYNSWITTDYFNPQHQYIAQKIKTRAPKQPFAEYDALARYLIDKFAKNAPTSAKKYRRNVYKRSRIEKAIYACFQHDGRGVEATISYMLKVEPAVELIFTELSYHASKYEPREKMYDEMKPEDIKQKLFNIYEQIVTETIETAKSAHWLDDYDSTYKSVYLSNTS